MARNRRAAAFMGLAACWLVCAQSTVRGDDWPMFGRDRTRNAVSPERPGPPDWHIKGSPRRWEGNKIVETYNDDKNIKWSAPLGSQTFGDPVVANGLVYVGTNSGDWKADGGALMILRERDGKLLYKHMSPRLPHRFQDWPGAPLGCSPLVEGNRVWFTTNRCEVVCLDVGPLQREEGEPAVVWKLDMIKEFGVVPEGAPMGIVHSCSVGSYRDFIYVITGNGVQEGYRQVAAPNAPSLVCLDKSDGSVVWQDKSPGPNIMDGQWGSPLVIEINGRGQVIAPLGDGWVRSFDPLTGKLIWEFDMNRKEAKWSLDGSTRTFPLSAPVFYRGRVYIASGAHPEFGELPGRLCCIDPTKEGDISSELAVDADGQPLPRRRIQAVDTTKGEKAIANPNSGLVWDFVQCGPDRLTDQMGATGSNVAIHDGLVIVPTSGGVIHCLDADTGQRHWFHDAVSAIFSSPLIVDGKVYVTDEDGDVMTLPLSKENPNGQVEERYVFQSTHCSPVFANGVLYITTRNRLYAIQAKEDRGKLVGTAEGDWPQWRGPNRDNVSTETGLLREWPEAGPPLLWQTHGIGEGESSLSVADRRVYTLGCIDEDEYAVALDRTTGELVWRVRIGPAPKGKNIMRWLSQRSPTIDGDRVYVFAAFGQLVCLQAPDGKELWRRDYTAEFEGKPSHWGYCDFPLVDGDKLICTPGGQRAAMVALDKKTGHVIWACSLPKPEPAAHSAVMAAEIDGVRQYVNILGGSAIGVAADDGRLLWQHAGVVSGSGNVYAPIVRGNQVYCLTTGYGRLLGLTRIQNGFEYTVKRLAAPLQTWLDGAVMVGDRIYTYSSGRLSTLQANDGELLATHPLAQADTSRAAVTWADERLYLRNQSGQLFLIEIAHDGCQIKGAFQGPHLTTNPAWSFPVISRRRLFLRDQNALFCYNVSADALEKQGNDVKTVVLPPPVPPPVPSEAARRRTLRSIFVPTPQDIVDKMLDLANVKETDVVCDLGSGDGRIVVTAAKRFACRAIGYELDRELVDSSRENAMRAGVEQLVTIEHQDLFTADLSSVDVVAVYLLPKQLENLIPQLEKLKAGSRIVSHHFEIPGVAPDKTIEIDSAEDENLHRIHIWTTPLTKDR